ncbi:MAG TPA: energy transducer TonB [Gemmatimonadaceae bacterium]|nr:energy transducer TonB [Gemmatimonadaceae bacterium]
MFGTLLETSAKRERRTWGSVASVAVHAGIVLVLVAAGRTDARPAPPPPPPGPTVIYIDPAEQTGHRGRSGSGGSTGTPDNTLVPPGANVGPASIDVDPGAAIPTGLGIPGDTTLLRDIVGSGGGAGSGRGGPDIASELTVDDRVGIATERPPRYPPSLRALGITGTVVLRFVVDTTGRADLGSVRVLESPHEQFTSAVLASLRDTRFTPGRIRGRAVPTLVQRSFRFAIEDRP